MILRTLALVPPSPLHQPESAIANPALPLLADVFFMNVIVSLTFFVSSSYEIPKHPMLKVEIINSKGYLHFIPFDKFNNTMNKFNCEL